MLAGVGVLLRLQWGRILTFIVAIVAILWALDSVDAYRYQEDVYRWKTALIPFAAAQVLYGTSAVVVLIKNGATFVALGDAGQSGVGRPIYVWSAWASPIVGVAVFVALWVLLNQLVATGERRPLFVVLLLTSAAGGLAGVIGLSGIRSRRDALTIIPGALLGICINGCIGLMCLACYAYEGTRP